jgi:ABC-type transport system involved in cytochrome c biogenesis permease subunit
MTGIDVVNGAFELSGGLFLFLNVLRLLRDKKVSGVSLAPVIFFSVWGLWNLYYYPSLGQWCSLVGGVTVVIMNTVWVGLALYYGRGREDG